MSADGGVQTTSRYERQSDTAYMYKVWTPYMHLAVHILLSELRAIHVLIFLPHLYGTNLTRDRIVLRGLVCVVVLYSAFHFTTIEHSTNKFSFFSERKPPLDRLEALTTPIILTQI